MTVKNLTYKKKLRILGVGFVAFLVVTWSFSFSDTFSLASDCRIKREKLKQGKALGMKMSLLQKQIAYMDNLIGSGPDSTKTVMDALLEAITAYCNEKGCTLSEISPSQQARDQDFMIETNIITLEGNFKNLLDLVYLLEQKKKNSGKIISLNYFSKKNNKTKNTMLYLTLYIQHYKKITS